MEAAREEEREEDRARRGSEGVDGGSAASVSTLRRMARVTVGEARRARETAGGSAAGEGMAEWLGLRAEGRGGYIYRADAGPATFTGPCSGRHRGPTCRPKHGTDLVPGRHGHAACRAGPCSGRAGPRAARRAGRKWTCIGACAWEGIVK